MLALMLLGQFFDGAAVDFWGTKRKQEAPPASWVEPGHTPPAPVARLLDNPSRENALAYLKWQEDRLARLQAALAAIEAAKPREKEVLYFTQENCAFCAAQDAELAAADLGGRTVKRLGPRDAPELWARHRLSGTPTLVIDGEALRGLQTRAQIERRTK